MPIQITIDFDDLADAMRAYERIEELLAEMGEAGLLSMGAPKFVSTEGKD